MTLLSLQAEGHTWFYSQAKEKKEAILFTWGAINTPAPSTYRRRGNLPHSAESKALQPFIISLSAEQD